MSNKRQGGSSSFFGAGMTTTASISLVLLLLGLTALVALMGQGITSYVKENMTVSVEIPSTMTEKQTAALQQQIQSSRYAKEVLFIDKEEIKQQLIQDLGRDPEEVLGYNPASSCFEIKLKAEYANTDSVKLIEKDLKSKNTFKSIIYSQEDLDLVNSNLAKIGTLTLVLALILMFISFTLIRNTIRLNIYSKRFTINTMQLVGATNAFIRKPFLQQTVLCGIIAAFLANIFITIIVYTFIIEYPEFRSLVEMKDLLIIFGVVIVLGILLTYSATFVAVNKYLKMKTNNLYHI
ncbi:cell division protein FtsX [Dysgonomonas sp. 216]|uniref:cell division protein FtsX n=1 Tax=Dysgonomonas sp. 216 TaxID=2302934 RepID=UPI0013D674D1|nr:permease-like cell division protein FtsX [Dysgonomonas sp. 216]NDW18135.1 cell division protein FtsX [Dysgonomonas sp. 216]